MPMLRACRHTFTIGFVIVDEQRVEIVQEATPCRYELAPPSVDAATSGAAVDVRLFTPNGCA